MNLEGLKAAIGCSPDQLTIGQRRALTGKCIALEIYTPARLPRRRIEAAGDTPADCARQLRERGLDPMAFEFTRIAPSF